MGRDETKKELINLIQAELKDIDRLRKEIKEYNGSGHMIKRAKGSILHDFYNACERIFELIARQINGGVPASEQWHKKLLYQMTLSFGKTRPAVISQRLAAELDEYLAFRHLFRHIYGFELEGERVDRLVEKFDQVAKLFKKEITVFIKL